MSDVDWEACFDTNDIDKIGTKWTNTFPATAKQSIPNKDATIRYGDSPWYINDLCCSKRKIERIHKRAKKSPSLWPYFRQTRKKNILTP